MVEKAKAADAQKAALPTKVCTVCEQTKPITEFYERGGSSQCKACRRARAVKYRETHPKPKRKLPGVILNGVYWPPPSEVQRTPSAQINISGSNPTGGPQGPGGRRTPGYSSNAWNAMRAKYGDQLDQLDKRSQDPQTPAMFSSFDRAVDRFEATIKRFEQKFGGADAGFSSRIQNLRTNMGTPESSFKVAQILRQGNIAQGAGIRGGLSGQYQVGKIGAELQRIEATLEKQLKLETNPVLSQHCKRQKDAIYVRKSRIAANGSPGAVGSIAQGLGGLAGSAWAGRLGVYGAAAGAVAGAAYEVARAPYDANMKLAQVYGAGQQYRDFEISQRRLGAAGGFAGSDLEALRRSSPSNVTGQGLPPELRAFGLSPEDVTKYAGAYGVPQRTARGTLDIAEQARMASLAPGMGLSEESVAKMAGQARTMTFGNFSAAGKLSSPSFRRVMSMATTQGLDSSRLASSWSRFSSDRCLVGRKV